MISWVLLSLEIKKINIFEFSPRRCHRKVRQRKIFGQKKTKNKTMTSLVTEEITQSIREYKNTK